MKMEDSLKREWKQWWISYMLPPIHMREKICELREKMENKKLSVSITGLRGKTMCEFRQLPVELRTHFGYKLLLFGDDKKYCEIRIEICVNFVTHHCYHARLNYVGDIEPDCIMCNVFYFCKSNSTFASYQNMLDTTHFFNKHAFKIDDETFYVDYHLQCILLAMLHEHYEKNKCQELPIEFIFADCFLMKMIVQY